MSDSKNRVICLMGPTASGKTALAGELVERFPLEIVSVDSAMVYRGLDIGTAKPTRDSLKKAPHRLIDICDPTDIYSAARFCEDARREIDDILSHQKVPLLVGGTMLYFRALQKGLSLLPSADPLIREKLLREAEEKGWSALHARLSQMDPLAAARIHPHDSQRIQRALEVYALTGETLTTEQQKKTNSLLSYSFLNIAISPVDRGILHEKIEQRFDAMLASGFLEEVRALYSRGDLNLNLPSIRSVGYRQAWEYLSGSFTYEEMREKAIVATRQLAKRQLTWLRHWPAITWIEGETMAGRASLFAEIKKAIDKS